MQRQLLKERNIKNAVVVAQMAVTWNWYICLSDSLQKNSINPYVYADVIRDLPIHGRGKFRNIMTTGPANSGKTFMLKLLEIIYHIFSISANMPWLVQVIWS